MSFDRWLHAARRVIIKNLVACGDPISAIVLADRCGVTCSVRDARGRVTASRETQRRRVRMMVERMREQGDRVCACDKGYWLARSDAEWAAYQEARKKNGRFEFVRIGKMKKAANEKQSGQVTMFAGTDSDQAWGSA